MWKRFWKNTRPLQFCLITMTALCLLFLLLYGLSEKENELLQDTRQKQFLSLAAGEAAVAEETWQQNGSVFEVYHHLAAAADYLTMASSTAENDAWIEQLRWACAYILEKDTLPPEMEMTLHSVQRHAATQPTGTEPDYLQAFPCIGRAAGHTIAENLTETKHCLTPSAGRFLVYTCRNVYVKLSRHGGIPLEIAIYTPVRDERPYTRADCAFRSLRFREAALPHSLLVREPIAEAQTESGFRFWYPMGNGRLCIDIRADTGRVTGWHVESSEV